MESTSFQFKNIQNSTIECIPSQNIFISNTNNQLPISQHLLQNNAMVQIISNDQFLPVQPTPSASTHLLNSNLLVKQEQLGHITNPPMTVITHIPDTGLTPINIDEYTDIPKLEIPQFFIVETQFIEKNKLLIQGSQNVNEKNNDNDVVILSDDEENSKSENKSKSTDIYNTCLKIIKESEILNPQKNNSSKSTETDSTEKVIPTDSDLVKKPHNVECELTTEEVPLPCYVISKPSNTKLKENLNKKSKSSQKTCEIGVSTLPPWPIRSRSVQTINLISTSDKSIQCEILKCESDSDTESAYSGHDSHEEFLHNATITIYSNNKLECLLCGGIYDNLNSIKHHTEIHAEKSALCYKCGKKFNDEKKLKIHENLIKCSSSSNHHHKKRKKQFKFRFCPYPLCDHISYSLLEMYDHINYHSGEKVHVCVCGKKFISYEMYDIHRNVKKCTSKFYKFPYKIDKNERIFRRLTCKIYSLKNKSKYKSKTIIKNKNLCRYCHRIFRNSFVLFNHTRRKHKR